MSVNLPHTVPNRAKEIRRRALEFRRLSTDERLQRMFDLIAFGPTLMAKSPKREAARQWREKSEAEWQRAVKGICRSVSWQPVSQCGPAADLADIKRFTCCQPK